MKKLLPVLLLLLGLGAGGGLGWVLRPAPDTPPDEGGTDSHAAPADAHGGGHEVAPEPGSTVTLRLPNQFVVPLIEEGQVRAMVVIGLALELDVGHGFVPSDDEPRIRAAFLQKLFDHANIGGFDGVFTAGETLQGLRRSLRETARALLGPQLRDVLITELLRQES